MKAKLPEEAVAVWKWRWPHNTQTVRLVNLWTLPLEQLQAQLYTGQAHRLQSSHASLINKEIATRFTKAVWFGQRHHKQSKITSLAEHAEPSPTDCWLKTARSQSSRPGSSRTGLGLTDDEWDVYHHKSLVQIVWRAHIRCCDNSRYTPFRTVARWVLKVLPHFYPHPSKCHHTQHNHSRPTIRQSHHGVKAALGQPFTPECKGSFRSSTHITV